MRETPSNSKIIQMMFRITPAPAGNTLASVKANLTLQDHPRACGKHLFDACDQAGWEGSPPRLRETLLDEFDRYAPFRITPAPAGNTQMVCFVHCSFEDHPRACGKHSSWAQATRSNPGSPPRLRETRRARRPRKKMRGITPAPAGNTRFRFVKQGFH